MPRPVLDGRQRRHLRALGHHLRALVQIGSGGATPSITAALDQALLRHELVKGRGLDTAGVDFAVVAEGLAEGTASAHAQTLGHTMLFYRPHPKAPKIVFPAVKKAARRPRAGAA